MIRVVCIDESPYGGITIGEWYDAIQIIKAKDNLPGKYQIIDENGKVVIGYYNTNLFKTLEEIRNERIDKILL